MCECLPKLRQSAFSFQSFLAASHRSPAARQDRPRGPRDALPADLRFGLRLRRCQRRRALCPGPCRRRPERRPLQARHAGRDPGAPASTRRLPTDLRPTASEARRPDALGLALPSLVRLARSPGLREARDRDRLATRKFREYWTRLSRSGKPGRPSIPREVRDLIRRMSSANSLWGAPRIVGELAKIGIDLPRSTVAKCMLRRRKPSGPPSKSSRPSPGWTRRSTSSGTGTRSTGRGSDNGLWASASRRSASPHSRRGKTHSPSGIVLEVAEVGGLQHHYERVAA